MLRTVALAGMIAVCATSPALAQRTPGETKSTNTSSDASPVSDALFAEVAACSGMAEVALSELGKQKATDPELKKFSEKMIEDHMKLNGELKSLAAQKRMTLPATLDAKARFCSQSLGGLSGEKFDKCYAKAQLVAHMEAVAAFEAEAERGQDSEVRALAEKALPKIKEHLQQIKPIAMKYEKEMKREKSDSSDK